MQEQKIMQVSREEKKKEAIKRMKLWGIYPETIKQFDKEELISMSEPPLGAYYWVDKETEEKIRDFEKSHNALVYSVIRSYTKVGILDSYLFVSDYLEEWGMDIEDISEHRALAYVYNHAWPDCSEFGSIGIERTAAAGLKRVW